jgi:hypothetical protein
LLVSLALATAAAATSTGSATAARPAYAPKAGAVVSSPPLLRWGAVPRARHYNVQLYRNGRKILSRWPTRARYRVRHIWRYGDRWYSLRPAVYRWYVWPFVGSRYRRIRVRSTFLVGRAPANVSPPALTGTAQEGSTVTALAGRWTGRPAPRLAYKWLRCDIAATQCSSIAAATSATYQVGFADIGRTLVVVVTASNFIRALAKASAPTAPVVPGRPQNVVLPTIAGRPQQGEVLVAVNGSWTSSSPLTYAFQWERCSRTGTSCRAVAGATAQAYQLRADDLERRLRVTVTAANAGGSTPAASPLSPVIGRTLTGTTRGETLRGSLGSDVVRAGAGDDTVYGRDGDDELVGGEGADRLFGGPNDDVIDARGGGRDVVSCGSGQDRALVGRRDTIDRSCESVLRS